MIGLAQLVSDRATQGKAIITWSYGKRWARKGSQ